jgi:NAD(P)-dependent dehydrogenase (short-subunit alcohol dehydrogenase family)/acyl carrier protein
MSTAIATAVNGDLTETVRDIFAQVTRYPLEILDPAASLEEDLGIDSVKLGEIFGVIREKYQLSDKLNMSRESLRSIQSISQSLREYLAASALPQIPSPKNGNGSHAIVQQADFLAQVREIFCTVTRYPMDILEPHANLEEDLGIDSVKLGEVFAVLRERYNLPAQLDMPRERLKTIAGIAESLEHFVFSNATPAVNGAAASHSPVVEKTPAAEHEDMDQRVRAIFAEVTRYPLDILNPSAALEDDLGIDSVKLGEVFAVLREHYDLPEDLKVPRESLRTIGSITDALRQHVNPRGSVQPIVPPAILNGHNGHSNGRVKENPGIFESSFAGLTPERRPFEGKIALVTGSGRALGKDVAVYLAGLGATVIVNSFHSREKGDSTVEEIKAAGGKAVHIWGSVANPQQLSAMFDQIEKMYGGLDFFVNNASNGMLARLEEITVEHWEKAFRTNVVGLQQCAIRAVELMKRRGGGKIITLSSPASHGYVDYFGCMAAVKAAVESLTKTMAIEFAPYNIQVNCVSPGPIYGDLLNKWPESKRLIAEWEQATVCDRLCVDRDVSHFIAYLLSDAVKLFTGSVLVMDGGISVRWGGVSGEKAENKSSPVTVANHQGVTH